MIDSDLIEAVRKATVALFGSVDERCYVASEALYYLAGGKAAGIKPMRHKWGGYRQAHWWLQDEDGTVVDVTAAQFPSGKYDFYAEGKGHGFQTRCSTDATAIMALVRSGY